MTALRRVLALASLQVLTATRVDTDSVVTDSPDLRPGRGRHGRRPPLLHSAGRLTDIGNARQTDSLDTSGVEAGTGLLELQRREK